MLVRALRTGGLPDVVVIEKVESYGMAVGAEVFDTVLWAGRFAEAAHRVPVVMLPRRAVKLALCGDSRAKDANIRQALIDRFGGSAAVGRKAAPGRCTGSLATSGRPSRSRSRTRSSAADGRATRSAQDRPDRRGAGVRDPGGRAPRSGAGTLAFAAQQSNCRRHEREARGPGGMTVRALPRSLEDLHGRRAAR